MQTKKHTTSLPRSVILKHNTQVGGNNARLEKVFFKFFTNEPRSFRSEFTTIWWQVQCLGCVNESVNVSWDLYSSVLSLLLAMAPVSSSLLDSFHTTDGPLSRVSQSDRQTVSGCPDNNTHLLHWRLTSLGQGVAGGQVNQVTTIATVVLLSHPVGSRSGALLLSVVVVVVDNHECV